MNMDRRNFLRTGATLGAGMALAGAPSQAATPEKRFQNNKSPWPLVLNASTVRHMPGGAAGQRATTPPRTKIKVAAGAGWDGIELWMSDLEEHEQGGGNLKDLRQEIADLGLYVNNVIGLWSCMPEGEEAWNEQLPKTRNMMRMCSEVGAQGVAALPAPDRENFDLKWGAEKYRELMQIGREDYNIRVAFEFIGFIKGIHRLGQAAAIALDADDYDACLIMDTFHLYRGGSGFKGIRHLDPAFIWDFHWNDAPADPPQFEQRDRDRVLPGDGILPLNQALRDLYEIGYTGPLSLELFNEALWDMDPADVSRIGLEKMHANIAAALG